jgi:hypothetical protein
MIHDSHHTITAIAVHLPFGLSVTFADGATFNVDLGPMITSYPTMGALSDASLFCQARIDARGGYVVWLDDELEIAADNLRNLAIEQSGGIGHERLWGWMDKHSLTQERAALALGISRRMLNYYLSGSKSIPKTVWLACLGWESIRTKRGRSKHTERATAHA